MEEDMYEGMYEEGMYEEGYGDDNVLNKLSPEDREEKLKTQPVYSEEEDKVESQSNINYSDGRFSLLDHISRELGKYGEIIDKKEVSLGITYETINYKGFTYELLHEKGNVLEIKIK